MTEAVLDLSALDVVDLEALRLGAQVMTYKAGLADQPRVEAFFASLRIGCTTWLAVKVYLDLLCGNPRLSPAVRDACDAIRAQLGGGAGPSGERSGS